jgi:hypothetical protein
MFCILVSVLVMLFTNLLCSDTILNDGFVGALKVDESFALLFRTESQTFSLTGECSKKPLNNGEIKPGDAEWKLSSFLSDKSGITLTQTDNLGSNWSTTNTRSVKALATSVAAFDDYKLTFTMQVRFPKLKKSDNTPIIINGQQQYFGPYTCSTTVDLKVINIIIKRRVAGQGDFIKISDTQNVSSVIVGQKIELKVEVEPSVTEFTNIWTISGGKPIKDYQPTTQKAEVINLTNTDYGQKTITYYHTAGGSTSVKAKVTIKGKNKEKTVGYGILRPINIEEKVEWDPPNGPINLIIEEGIVEMICQVDINGACKSPVGGQGAIGFIQKVHHKSTYKIVNGTTGNYPNYDVWRLDAGENSFLYDDPVIIQSNVTKTVSTHDSPGAPVSTTHQEIHLIYEFKTYFMYKPTSGIWVTLASVDWNFECKYEKGKGITAKEWNPKNPVGTDSTELPTW